MNTNVNLLAPIGVMALLGASFLLVVAVLLLIQSLLVRRPGRAKFAMLAMLVIAGAYLAAILIFSLASHEKVLARGEEKHFCEIDCHLAYSVTDAQQTKVLGVLPNQTTAQGTYTVVTIKTRFDEASISSRRGDGLLYPNSRLLMLVDERGNRYSPSSQAGTSLITPLRPGASYTTDVVFDLPVNAKPSMLLINEGEWITHLVIGHENSPLHKKTSFQINLPMAPLAGSSKHFFYSAGWKKFENAWNLVIRIKQLAQMRPLLEAVLAPVAQPKDVLRVCRDSLSDRIHNPSSTEVVFDLAAEAKASMPLINV